METTILMNTAVVLGDACLQNYSRQEMGYCLFIKGEDYIRKEREKCSRLMDAPESLLLLYYSINTMSIATQTRIELASGKVLSENWVSVELFFFFFSDDVKFTVNT